MSLNIYTSKSKIPNNIKLIKHNDIYFNSIELVNNEINNRIVGVIDKAVINSKQTFIGRDKSLGALNKENLSTGTKTLLNIVSSPDKCFDVIECGQNALYMLPYITDGNILWEFPILHYIDDYDECDIEIHGKNFSSFSKFLDYVMN